MHYKNTVLAGLSLSKVVVLIILMNKWSFNSNKGNKENIASWPNSNSDISCKSYTVSSSTMLKLLVGRIQVYSALA